MKTEEEYRQLFLNHINVRGSEAETIGTNYWKDMTGHLNFYFSHESRESITLKAAGLLNENTNRSQPLDTAWQNVIRDFLGHNYWDQRTQSKKPEKKKTEEQKIFWKLFKYVWVVIQSSIILKIAIYYFGIEGANRPDQISPAWVWVFFGLSVCSLGFFAYNNHNKD